MSDPVTEVRQQMRFKAALEELVAEFEHASEALPPDEHSLRQWMQRARELYSRAAGSDEPGRNKLLLKIRAFRTRIWTMRADRRQYLAQRVELGLSSPAESIWKQLPAQLTYQRRHKLSLAIASTWKPSETDAEQGFKLRQSAEPKVPQHTVDASPPIKPGAVRVEDELASTSRS